jgi:hypothetical protein
VRDLFAHGEPIGPTDPGGVNAKRRHEEMDALLRYL